MRDRLPAWQEEKMSKVRTHNVASILFLTGLFLTGVACAGLLEAGPGQVAARATSTKAALPTDTAAPLYQQVRLDSAPWQEQGQPFGYRITAQVPVLVGSQDPRVQVFNEHMAAIVKMAVADFKQKLGNLPATPDSSASTFDLRYNLLSPPGYILSLKFDIDTFFTGAAHPGTSSQTVNFDLARGKEILLSDLFVADADFLTPISKYCIDQLDNRDIGFQGFELGATADPGNYRSWNITPEGLMITFDEYQVAPYAAGPQTVVIPYRELAQIIRPDGPLAAYMH
jgi:hypothetical protein